MSKADRMDNSKGRAQPGGRPEAASQLPYVAVLTVNPALAVPSDARLNFDAHLRGNPKALVLLAYATGGTPETLNPFIKEYIEKGIPVFLLSTNYASDKGIQKVEYGPNVEAARTGAIPLRDVNSNHVLEVVAAIQEASRQGLAGDELRDAIIVKFGTVARMKEGPLEEWSTEEDSLKHIDKTVSVFNAKTGQKILTGKVVGYTDLLGSGGILQPDPEIGFDNVQAAIKFPQDPTEYAREMAKYRFRVEN